MPIVGSGVAVDSFLTSETDTNTYTISVREGEVYELWVGGASPLLYGGELTDPQVTITGIGADQDDAEGNAAILTFEAPSTGNFAVTVAEPIGTAPHGLQTYDLTFTNKSYETDISDHVFATNNGAGPIEAVGTNMALAEGDTLNSSINTFSEFDVVAVFLNDDTAYTLTVSGAPGDGTMRDAFLLLMDSDGTTVAGPAFGSGAPAVVNIADTNATGWFFVRIGGLSTTGTYEFSYTGGAAGDTVPGDNSSSFNLPLSRSTDQDSLEHNSIDGVINGPGDSDYYAVHLVAGQTYQFDVRGEGASPLGDPEIVLRDSGGGAVGGTAFDDDGPASERTFTYTATSSGLFFLDVHADDNVATGGFNAEVILATPVPPTPVQDFASHQDDPAYVEHIRGTDRGDHLGGGNGDDVLTSGAGDDTLEGGDGANSIGDVQGNNSMVGGADQDTIGGGAGNDTIDGLAGDDTVDGGDGNNLVDGGDGDDLLVTRSGADTVTGGDGNDTIDGGSGSDLLGGGNGNDTFNNVGAGDTVSGGAGIDTVNALVSYTLPGDVENLSLDLLGSSNLNGTGNAAANVIFGNGGANTLMGLAGSDILGGGAGNDTLIGGAGKDLNTGGGGLDHIRFNALSESGTSFATRDAISTFAHGDKIDLSAIDANSIAAGNQAFIFSASQSLTHVAGQVIAHTVATNSFLVQADVNGDGAADFSLNVYTASGFGTFHSWDFIP